MQGCVHGAWTGRFLRFRSPGSPGEDWGERARAAAWTPSLSGDAAARGEARVQGWCTPVPPHDGALVADRARLVYAGSVAWRGWIREDTRSVPGVEVTLVADRACHAQHGRGLDEVRGAVRAAALARARQVVLGTTTPRSRVIEVVVTPAWAWVGRVAREPADRACFAALGLVADPDPGAWVPSERGPGWASLSRAVAHRGLADPRGVLGDRARLLEVTLGGPGLRVQATDPAADHRATCQALLGSTRPPGVRSLVIEVDYAGRPVAVTVDEHGVSRVDPPRSAGGLVADRVIRRAHDARAIVDRVAQAMAQAWHEVARA